MRVTSKGEYPIPYQAPAPLAKAILSLNRAGGAQSHKNAVHAMVRSHELLQQAALLVYDVRNRPDSLIFTETLPGSCPLPTPRTTRKLLHGYS